MSNVSSIGIPTDLLVKNSLINVMFKHIELTDSLNISPCAFSDKFIIDQRYYFEISNVGGLFDFYFEEYRLKNIDMYKELCDNDTKFVKLLCNMFNTRNKFIEMVSKAITSPDKHERVYSFIFDVAQYRKCKLYGLHIPSSSNIRNIDLLYKSKLTDALKYLTFYVPNLHCYFIYSYVKEYIDNPDIGRDTLYNYYSGIYNQIQLLFELIENYKQDHPIIQLLHLNNL